MASKRMKNRTYWVAVKARTYYHSHSDVYRDADRALRHAFVNGSTDAFILSQFGESLSWIEEHYGPAGHTNVGNAELWTERAYVDQIISNA